MPIGSKIKKNEHTTLFNVSNFDENPFTLTLLQRFVFILQLENLKNIYAKFIEIYATFIEISAKSNF